MRPEEEIELDEGEYGRATASVSEGIVTAGASVDITGEDFRIGQGDGWRADGIDGWVSTIGATGINENDQHVTTSISLGEDAAMKVVEELADMWDWEGDGYSSSESK